MSYITILWLETDHDDECKLGGAGDEINNLALTFYSILHQRTLNNDLHLGNSAVICLYLKINTLIKILFADLNL